MIKNYIYLIVILLTGCIDPVYFKFAGQTEHLVIEAELTNEKSLQYIRISRSSSFSYPYNQYEKQATVYVTGIEGEYISYHYSDRGYYYPDSLQVGIIGHTYTLHVITPGGNRYQSTPVTMKAPIPIDSVYFEYDKVLAVVKGRKDREPTEGYNVLVNYKDPGETSNFYRWSYNCQFEVKTHPENFVDYECCFMPVHRPKKCCAYCWVKETSDNFIVNDDRLTNGQEVVGQKTLFIPFQKYLNMKYKLNLFQHSITEEEFLFYKYMINQSQSNGGILDPPPTEFKGNIFNVNNPDEKVIGIFDVSGVSSYHVTLIGPEIPYYKLPFVWDDDCRTIENSTAEKPEDW